MTSELTRTDELTPASSTAPVRLPPVPWRDPHAVSPAELARYIETLEAACAADPRSADLRTCLGMAYAMDYQVYKSMDVLELAVELEPNNFFAQLKYSELHYRLRALVKAESETLRASELAKNSWELSLARKQLLEIRRLMREGTQKPEWTKPLMAPSFWLLAMAATLCVAVYLR